MTREKDVVSLRLRRFQAAVVSGLLLVGGILYLTLPLVALEWAKRPFPGFYLDPNLVVNASGRTGWPVRTSPPSLGYPDRILALDGRPLTTAANFRAELARRAVGDSITLSVIQPEQTVPRDVTVTLFRLDQTDLWQEFWALYLMGLATLAVGLWAFRQRPFRGPTQLFALFALALAWSIGGYFDSVTSQAFIRFYLFNRTLVGALNLALAAVFPHEIRFVRRWPRSHWLALVPALVLAGWSQLWLHLPSDPWAYVVTWRFEFLFNGLSCLLAIAILAYRGFRSRSPLVRQQGRVPLVAAVVAFAPISFWLINFNLPFNNLYLSTLAIYPLALGYTIVRYRLLDIRFVLRRSIMYTLLTMAVLAIVGLAISLLQTALGTIRLTDSPLLLAMLVLFVVIAVDPLRSGLQAAVDRYLLRPDVPFDALLRDSQRELAGAHTLDAIERVLLKYVESGLPDSQPRLYLADESTGDFHQHAPGGAIVRDRSAQSFAASTPLAPIFVEEAGILFLTEERTWPAALRDHRDDVRRLDAALVVPLIDGQRLLGWLALGQRPSGAPYSSAESAYLLALASQSLLSLERATMIRRLERQVNDLNLLSQFSQALNFTVRFDDLLEMVAAHCQRLLDVTDFAIHLRGPMAGVLYPALIVAGDERRPEKEGMAQPPADPQVLRVASMGQPIATTDDGGRAWLGVPLNAGAETLGVMHAVAGDRERPFSQRQSQLFGVFGDRLATALDGWQVHQQLKGRAHQLATLNEVTRSINAVRDLETLLELILDKSIDLLETEAGSFLLLDEQSGDLVFEVVRGPAAGKLTGRHLPMGVGLAGSVAQSGRPIVVNEVQQDDRWFSALDEDSRFVTHAVLTVPLLRQHEVLGVLQVVNKRGGGAFDDDDQALLTAFAGQAVVALENARLLKQTDAELEKRVNELSLLQQLDRELAMTLELPSVLDLALDWLLRLTQGIAGAVVLQDEKGALTIQRTRGYDQNLPDDGLPEETLQAGLLGKVLRSGEPCLVDDVSAEPLYLTANPATRSQLTLPVIHQQRVIGAIAVESDQTGTFDEATVATAVRVTNHCAVAIANALLYAQVIAANQAKSEFVSMVSHELKTPLTSIRGYTELMLNGLTGPISQQQREFLETTLFNANRMSRQIQDLTDISRIETGRLAINRQAVSMVDIISQTLQTTQSLCDAKQIDVQLDLPADLPPLWGDPERLVQVLTNLISNACKYSPPETTITVAVRVRTASQNGHSGQPMIMCSVQDEGYGIAPADQARLFTKFFRSADTNIQQSTGTGLGLSITRGIVQLHGGDIWFESALGEGTIFTFSVPVAG